MMAAKCEDDWRQHQRTGTKVERLNLQCHQMNTRYHAIAAAAP